MRLSGARYEFGLPTLLASGLSGYTIAAQPNGVHGDS